MARIFNGDTDRITYGHVSALAGVSKATLSYWVYPRAGGDAYGIQVGHTDPTTADGLCTLRNNVNDGSLFIFARNAAAVPFAFRDACLTVEVWNHVHVVYDGDQGVSDDRLRLWVNGESQPLTHSGTHPTTIGTSPDPVVRLGGLDASFNGAFRLAEVAFWSGVAITDPALIGLLRSGASPLSRASPIRVATGALAVYLPLDGDNVVDLRGRAGNPRITGTTVGASPWPRPVDRRRMLYVPQPQVAGGAGDGLIVIRPTPGGTPFTDGLVVIRTAA